MKMSYWLTVAMMIGYMTCTAFAAEEGYLVKVVGFDRKVEWQTMTENDFKTLEKNIKLEQKLFPKAVELAGKEWRADELNKGIAFPGSRLMCRSIGQAQAFPSMEKAEAQLTRIQDQEARKAEKAEKNNPGAKKPNKALEKKEGELMQASDLVKTKLAELVTKAGGDAKDLSNAPAPEKVPEAKGEKKADAKGKAEAVKKAL